MAADCCVSFAICLIKCIACIYDVLTFIPAYLIDRPWQRKARWHRVKSRPLKDGDPSSPYRCVDVDTLTTTPIPGCYTLDEMFDRAAGLFSKRQCFGTRKLISEEEERQPNGKIFRKAVFGDYRWQSYAEVEQRVVQFGSGLLALGQQPRGCVCVYAETRAEWLIAAFACFKCNIAVVTLYSTLGDEALVHGVTETEVSIVVTSSELVPKLKKLIGRLPLVKHLIYMEGDTALKLDGAALPETVSVQAFRTVETIGARPENMRTMEARERPTRDDLALVMYTSGSTGLPKGVMISNGNIMSGISGQIQRVPGLGPSDTHVGYLPLAHVLELTAEVSCVGYGTRIGFSSPTTLLDQSTRIRKGSLGDVSVLHPTLMSAVPLIMDRLYKSVQEKVDCSSKFKRALFRYAYDYKVRKYQAGFRTPIVNCMVFGALRRVLGGHVRMMLSGGAPLSEDTQLFMNICFCCPVGQGYGLTETCGAGTVQEVTDRSTSRVGAPLECCDVMFVDWAEGNYLTSNLPYPRGEVWIGGGNVAHGYYKNPSKTAEDFRTTSDGRWWFATGDIGEMQPDGCLRIVDRKKDLVKLQGGEYVSLGKVETALKLCPYVDNVCVYVDSRQTYAVCLVVPNRKNLLTLASGLGVSEGTDWEQVCRHEGVQRATLESLQEHAAKAKLEKFEVPQKVRLVAEEWMPESGLVTDTFKLKRKNIFNRYMREIDDMYTST